MGADPGLTAWVAASDADVAEALRSAPRGLSQQEVDRLVRERDAERGEYVPHGGSVHHVPGESRS